MKQKMIDIDELKEFIRIADVARKSYAGSNGATDEAWYRSQGISQETLDFLRRNHYTSQRKGKSLWISWTNKFYPNKTIGMLMATLEKIDEEEGKGV